MESRLPLISKIIASTVLIVGPSFGTVRLIADVLLERFLCVIVFVLLPQGQAVL